jgi:hypothetical protein
MTPILSCRAVVDFLDTVVNKLQAYSADLAASKRRIQGWSHFCILQTDKTSTRLPCPTKLLLPTSLGSDAYSLRGRDLCLSANIITKAH